MSTYSSSSAGDSVYSTPGPSSYQLVTPGTVSDPRDLSQGDLDRIINALRSHRINTITELRRVEKTCAHVNHPGIIEAMTSAWAYYVNSNNLLSELRGLTGSYPFSSACLDEAKWAVLQDPNSARSWNYCWLVLTKIQTEYA
ncbi:MAG: hypothetical protein Q9227_008200 [Pyrenula ochraceoflavens]